MDIKKWVPWNWFKKEEENADTRVPVRHVRPEQRASADVSPVAFLHQEIDRMFDDFWGRWPAFGLGRNFSSGLTGDILKPTLDLSASEKEYIISVEIPGVDEKDVKLEMADDTLTIRGEKKLEKEEKEKNYYRMERSYGSFQRVLSLPADADQDSVKAKFKKGILTVKMAKKAMPESYVKRIEVKSV